MFFMKLTILNFGSILKNSPAHPHVVRNVIFKFQKKLTNSFRVLRSQKKYYAGLARLKSFLTGKMCLG